MVAAAVIGGAVIGGVASNMAAGTAADAQTSSTNASIAAQQQATAAAQALLKPYSDAGIKSLTSQQDLLGLNGNSAQQTAIDTLKNSSQFNALKAQGENSILQNASATGGLRGGNTQAALAQFSPALLNQLINDQYTKLGGITSIGQNAAAGSGNQGMQSAGSISSLLQQQGAAQAGLAMAQGRNTVNMINGGLNGIGMYYGLGGGNTTNIDTSSSVAGFGGSGLGNGISGGGVTYQGG